MAKKNGGGPLLQNPYNEVTSGGASENYEDSGGGLYGSWDEVMSMHLSQDGASLVGSPNIEVGRGIMGGPAAGEANPAGFSPTDETYGGNGGKK
jgi:hypothetical protein